MNWYIIDEDSVVLNIIVYDGVSEYEPEEGLRLVSSTNSLSIGNTYNEEV